MKTKFRSFLDVSYIFSIIFFVGYALIALIPIIWMFLTSLKQQTDMFYWPPKIFFKLTFEHYYVVLRQSAFFAYLKNSIIVALVSSTISIVFGSMCAYSISRFDFHGKKLLLFWVLFTRLIPPLSLIVPLFLVIRKFGLYDQVFGLALVHCSFSLPMTVLLMVTYFDEIPRPLEEAAFIDGCNQWGVLYHIVLPLAKPGLVATSIFNIVFSWNEFPFALMLTSRNARTLPISITEWLVERGLLWGEMSASGIMIIIPVCIFAMLVQRQLIRGLTMGAVKE